LCELSKRNNVVAVVFLKANDRKRDSVFLQEPVCVVSLYLCFDGGLSSCTTGMDKVSENRLPTAFG
jgi:hypothetical protein